MKFKTISLMAILCLMLSSFLFGLYFGRNMSGGAIDISKITDTTGSTHGIIPSDVPTTSTEKPVVLPTETQNNPPAPTETPTQPATAGKVNINTADLATLMTLEGIGETYAQRIIDYRNVYGPFSSIADITNVPGIGAKRFEAIMDQITVGG